MENTESSHNREKSSSRLLDDAQVEELRRAARGVADEASGFIRKYPLRSVGGALAIGFVLGALTGSRGK